MPRTIEIYADCASLDAIEVYANRPDVSGITTNPSLMKAAGIKDYSAFAKTVLALVPREKMVSFEVLSDDPPVIRKQAERVAGWGPNVLVKVPIRTSMGYGLDTLISGLAMYGMAINVTAICDYESAERAAWAVAGNPDCVLSLFAGRVADAGRDPKAFVKTIRRNIKKHVKVLWASPRQVFDVKLAMAAGANIITLTPQLIQRMSGFGRSLEAVTQGTVKQFTEDAKGISWGVE